MKILHISIVLLISFVSMNAQTSTSKLKIKVNNLAVADGQLMLEMIDKDDKVYLDSIIKVSEKTVSFEICNVPNGTYGIRYFHDENSNGKMDSYFVGIPMEGYGFSNNPPSRFGAPALNKILFILNENKEILIETVNW